MTIKKGQIIDVKITDMAFGGKGIARVDGFAVFVDQAVPLDLVSIQITKKKKNFANGRIVKLIEPSPDRINPPCEFSGFCGGCKWQFLEYGKQIFYKQQHVIDSLKHIGFIEDAVVHPTIPSKLLFGYRNKMEFSCSDRRWLLPDEMGLNLETGFAIGLHVPGTFYKVLDIRKCLLQPDLGNLILDDVGNFIKSSDLPVYGLRSHVGFWRFLMLRHSSFYDQWMVNIITADENRKKVQPLADLLIKKYAKIASVINNITSKPAGVAIGEYEICLAGSSHIKDKIGAHDFEISANSFFQTNTSGATRLYETVKMFAELIGNETVIDLYSGTGTIPIYISDSAKEIIGIEINESAVKDAQNNCASNHISNCRFICGDIIKCLAQITKRPDVMIIDPPRSGMHQDVVKQVIDMAPDRIVYVSCNPATLARDIFLMKDIYRVIEVQPVDMFPHTYHIESVTKLAKR
ncbi:MAG: 23S rRNA (uracil(1939)-C(5))-methyltransferase RlmD [Thermodesulfobacteriota bacterium]|nr:23S rRNA (uracil(1939)-C(5))-methyltransferase RlmD [Thermodesulfobacteriota bacterium]